MPISKQMRKMFLVNCLKAMAIYGAITVLLYFLMGEQLHLRVSRANLESVVSSEAIAELTHDTVVEQTFTTKVQRIETIALPWSTFFRTNEGTVTVELIAEDSGESLLQKTLEAGTLPENTPVAISFETPLEGYYQRPLLLRLTADATLGHGVSPLKGTIPTEGQKGSLYPEGVLRVNGEEQDGTLCFSLSGTDYIWTGLHYWKFVAGFAVVLFLGMWVLQVRMQQGRATLVSNGIAAVTRYRFLMEQLIKRDFKAKYKRSVLGIFWSFLNPLLTMSVQYLVFSNIFRFDIPYYSVYLLTGIVSFNFFSECTNMALTSIVGNAPLITKVYVPKYIYPLTRTVSSGINLLISMLPLVGIALLNGLLPTKAYILAVFPVGCLIVFSFGVGMLLAALMVFFRDTQFLWGVLSMIWMYLTPIFYSVDFLPSYLISVLKWNPLYHFITFLRICIIDGISPEPIAYVQCLIFALGSVLIGGFLFKKTQDRFILYL